MLDRNVSRIVLKKLSVLTLTHNGADLAVRYRIAPERIVRKRLSECDYSRTSSRNVLVTFCLTTVYLTQEARAKEGSSRRIVRILTQRDGVVKLYGDRITKLLKRIELGGVG